MAEPPISVQKRSNIRIPLIHLPAILKVNKRIRKHRGNSLMSLNCRLNVLQSMLYIRMVENVLEILDSLAVSCGPFGLWEGS